jgi:hexosaminidase
MIMTSWSTSGKYSPVFENSDDIIAFYAIRHVYPMTSFNMLLKAHTQSLRTDKPLDIPVFIREYSKHQYGFDSRQSASFSEALTTTPYEVKQGEVMAGYRQFRLEYEEEMKLLESN